MKTGYDYNITISQVGANNAGLAGRVDIIDLAIYQMLLDYAHINGCKQMQHSGKTYYFFSWTLIKDRIPYARVNSRSGCKRRFKTLCDCNLLEAHPDNQSLGQSWFCIGSKYNEFKNYPTHPEKSHPVHENVHPPSIIMDTPVHENGHNDYTNKDYTNKEISIDNSNELPESENPKPEPKIDKNLETFDVFRKAYPGTKRGNKIEFDDFKKKHKDWKEVLPTLSILLQRQIELKAAMKSTGQFVPEWKHLKTWLNQRSWEEDYKIDLPLSKTDATLNDMELSSGFQKGYERLLAHIQENHPNIWNSHIRMLKKSEFNAIFSHELVPRTSTWDMKGRVMKYLQQLEIDPFKIKRFDSLSMYIQSSIMEDIKQTEAAR